MIPTSFFVTSGKAISPVSELNAFDLALKKASIAQCNLVNVSSIIPQNCKEVKSKKLPSGQITFCVLARMDGTEGTTISAGIGWTPNSKGYGLVAEHHGHMDSNRTKEILEWKMKEMSKIRNLNVSDIRFRVETLRVPMDNYGCTISAFVYLEGEKVE